MKKYDVLCPHCCGTFLETNSHFREDGPANGSMFEPKEHIKDAGWSVFPLYDSTEYADITCPSCGGVLVDSLGKLLRTVEIGEIEGPASKEKVMAKSMDELMAEYDPEVPVISIVGLVGNADGTMRIDNPLPVDAKVNLSVTQTASVTTKKTRKTRTVKAK